MHATKIALILLISIGAPSLCFSQARSYDFDGVTCKKDIAKELLGRHMPHEQRVAPTEIKYKGIALRFLWGYGEPPDPYLLEAWSICGRAYVLLLDLKDIVRDVVAAPPSHPENWADIGTCFADGQKYPEAVTFVREMLSDYPNHPRVRVEHAWSIDIKKLTFTRLDTPIKAGGIDCE